jgi:hypothetical protein
VIFQILANWAYSGPFSDNDMIIAFSGLSEHLDEAVSIATARLVSETMMPDRSDRSNRQSEW